MGCNRLDIIKHDQVKCRSAGLRQRLGTLKGSSPLTVVVHHKKEALIAIHAAASWGSPLPDATIVIRLLRL